MKARIYSLLLLLLSFVFLTLQAQDSIYIYQGKKVVSKYAIGEIDSLTFSHQVQQATPTLTDFSFDKDNNSQLYEDKECEIKKSNISATLPLIKYALIASFETAANNTVTIDGVEQISGKTINNFSQPLTYTVTTPSGEQQTYTVDIKWQRGLPHISINTANNTPISSKEEYLNAYLVMDGRGIYESSIDSIRIKGRGNSSWGLPKKPFKIKLNDKKSLFGLKSEKDWVLLANYLDPVHLLNLVAFKTGQLLQIPFTNEGISVNLTLNGEYQGIYTLTEQIERKKNRVNIDKKKGVLLELDAYFDETFKFKSPLFQLPVNIKYPKLEDEKPDEQDKRLQEIRNEFVQMEQALNDANFPSNNYTDYIDINALVKFLIVYNLTDNREISHPKSIYMYKDKGGKYTMGPIWDFDWAYGYEKTGEHFAVYDQPILQQLSKDDSGYKFFGRIMQDPAVQRIYKTEWENFKTNHLPHLIEYIDTQSQNIASYQPKDEEIWHKYAARDYDQLIEKFKSWLQNRANYIDNQVKKW